MRTHTASRHEKCWGRRAIITAGAAGVIVGAARMVGAARPPDDEEGVIVPEDLMKEHGVLNHCLLMYEEGIRRVQAQAAVNPATTAPLPFFVSTWVDLLGTWVSLT